MYRDARAVRLIDTKRAISPFLVVFLRILRVGGVWHNQILVTFFGNNNAKQSTPQHNFGEARNFLQSGYVQNRPRIEVHCTSLNEI